MQRIEHFIPKALNGRSPPANLLSFCEQLMFTCGPDHSVLLEVFSLFSLDNLRLTAQAERYLEAHVSVCRSLGFSACLAMEVAVDALAAYTAQGARNQPTPFRLRQRLEAMSAYAIATRLQQVDEATPAHNEAWPQCLQPWLSLLIRKNAGVDTAIRAEVARVMNTLHY
jgi:hypothetical protein